MVLTRKNIVIAVQLALLNIFLASCITTKSVLIEIPIPSTKELPSHIQSLTIVNRTVDNQYFDLETDTIQQIFYKHEFNYDTVIFDLQSADTLLQALGDLLYESGRYDIVIPEARFLPFEKNAFLTSEMPWNEVRELCNTYNTDAVLSVDHFKTRISTDFDSDTFFDPGLNSFISAPIARMKVYYEALLRVYDPSDQKIVSREFFRDTLFWEDADRTARELMRKFTPVKQALSETGIAVALDYTDKIGTSWRTERRTLFSDANKTLKQASLLVSSGELEQAKYSLTALEKNTHSKALKSKAQYNLAVVNELMGETNMAISWALKSYNTMYRLLTYEYLEILKRRKNELQKQEK